jgi:hypothetical protein
VTGEGSNHSDAPHTDDGTHGDGDPSVSSGQPFVGPYQLPDPAHLTPPRDGAFFWSGRDANEIGVGPVSAGGSGVSERLATMHNGTTLEGLIDQNQIAPPKWSFDDPDAERWWSEVSRTYASKVEGEVHAVVGSNLRPGNIWETVELPRLMDNPAVTRIVVIDPDTGLETVIFER